MHSMGMRHHTIQVRLEHLPDHKSLAHHQADTEYVENLHKPTTENGFNLQEEKNQH